MTKVNGMRMARKRINEASSQLNAWKADSVKACRAHHQPWSPDLAGAAADDLTAGIIGHRFQCSKDAFSRHAVLGVRLLANSNRLPPTQWNLPQLTNEQSFGDL